MQEVIEQFYEAFKNLDSDQMAACYHKDVHFEDPAFGVLKGDKASNMWHMLCHSQKGKNFQLEYRDIVVKDRIGSAHWEARYNFSKTGRRVHNIIEAKFEFAEGKIIRHIDQFNLYRWSKQALGTTGLLIGWTPFFKKKLMGQTNNLLHNFEQNMAKE